MTTHDITDNDLLLYHYRDGLDAAERARIATALVAEPELAARLHLLVARLDAVAALPEVPVPAEVRQRWHATLDRLAAADTERHSGWHRLQRWRWPAFAAVAAACLVIAFRLGMQLGTDRVQPLVAANTPSRCECGLKWHLAAVERQLAGLATASDEERVALIDAVIAQNRLYAIAAERGGDQRLAGALRSFTPILERLASTAASSGTADAEMAQLNFELQVVQARLSAEAGIAAAPAVTL